MKGGEGQLGHAVTRFLKKKTLKMDVRMSFLTSCLNFKKIRRLFLEEQVIIKKIYNIRMLVKFDIKVGMVKFDLARYN